MAKRLMLMVLVLACLGLLTAASANAAVSRTQVQMAQTESPSSDEDADDSDEEEEEEAGEESKELALAVIGFGFLVILAILAYVYFAQDQFYELAATSLRRLGKVPPLEHVDPTLTSRALSNGGLQIQGDVAIAVGQARQYSAKSGDDTVEATWAVSDKSLADITPTTRTKTVTVKAKRSGTLRLTATAESGTDEATIHLVTVEGGSLGALPFVGRGYGSLVIAIFVAALIGVLGLVEVLGSEAVATLFGTLLGYIFAKAVQSNGDGSSGSAGPGATGADAGSTGGAGA